MGLFDKKRGAAGKHGAPTIIAEGARITGELTLSSNIQIDGEIKGTIRTEYDVTISPTGHVEGSIYANNAIVNGRFEGEIFAKNIDILSRGDLKGNITCSEVTIAKGGLFLGTSETVTNDEVVCLAESKENALQLEQKITEAKVVEQK
ncbi:bactofilin family protein [Vibrio sp. SCSIO 43137]|uniref:bactofilin family protein n=1 Tax=Vibrio sp. SCSIO 43137 TaxID=3021011 RepID=UPI00230801AE|nr:polymer-forming cytoskeletal protein [Vibrio sp. SCSIO 43137]WCE31049.1 polymer-forming cytoskeletal protein [Vibrio sp. SCSIO 43137]